MNEGKSQTKSVCKPFRNQLIALKSAQKRLFLNKTETTAKSLRRILGPKKQRKQIGISFQRRDNTIVRLRVLILFAEGHAKKSLAHESVGH